MAYTFDPVTPQSTESIYKRQLARLLPDIRQQEANQYRFIQNLLQRTGTVNPSEFATRSVAPFATAVGQAGATAATQAETIGRQEREAAERLNIMREQMQLQQQQWEKNLAEQEKQRQQSLLTNLFQYTGFTPQLLELGGLQDLTKLGNQMDWRQFQRQLGNLNLPGQPFQQTGLSGTGPFLNAQQKLALQSFYPGTSRSYKNLAAQNWGWLPQGQWGY